jgi:hypothetical protein
VHPGSRTLHATLDIRMHDHGTGPRKGMDVNQTPFDRAVDALTAAAPRFDAGPAHDRKRRALAGVARTTLRDGATLVRYHDCLLYLLAHPSDAALARAVEAELARLARHLRQRRGRHGAALSDRGLPWVDMVTAFSHDATRWLLDHPHCRQSIDTFDAEAPADLNAILKLTLCSIEHSETTAGLDNHALLDALGVPPASRLRFILDELGRFDALPYVKDQLYGSLRLYTRLTPTDRRFSKAYSRLPMPGPRFYQRTLLRDFDPLALIDSPLPAPRPLQGKALDDVIRVIKTSLVLTCRETDPGTYLDPRTVRVVDVEHGLTVAVYGMQAQRQLALESYVGFTLFKNGLAAAYGGAWLLGPRAAFGMNIFEPYRGGESGFMMCQVLRTYRQLFGASCFEVDAHQFGLDNPDGIATGAFWFYDRHGFRPLDPALDALAARERARIRRRPGYRSSERTLLRFTGSDVALNFGRDRPTHPFDLLVPVTRMVARRFGGDRRAAEQACLTRFERSTGPLDNAPAAAIAFALEMALVAEANNITDPAELAILRRQADRRADDLFGYQRGWFEFFARHAPAETASTAREGAP